MSRSPVVDQQYRLQPYDLHGIAMRAVIQEVTFQGLEEVAPVLHFASEPAKHLVLDNELRRELIAIVQSSLCEDWIGQAVELRPVQQGGKVRIGLVAPGRQGTVQAQVARLRHWQQQQVRAYGQTLLLILALLLVLAAVSLLEDSEQFWQALLDYVR